MFAATVAYGTSAAPLTSQLGNGSGSIGNSVAQTVAGNAVVSSTVSMGWRSRAANEIGTAKASLPLFSDVVNLNGVSTNNTQPFVMSMSYSPSAVVAGTSFVSDGAAANAQQLYLGYYSSSGSAWVNAVSQQFNDGNSSAGTAASINYQGTFAQFVGAGQPGASQPLSALLGSWGVSTATDTVWAVVDHDAEFAAVPEPGTLALLAAGVAALGLAYRRRKAAKA